MPPAVDEQAEDRPLEAVREGRAGGLDVARVAQPPASRLQLQQPWVVGAAQLPGDDLEHEAHRIGGRAVRAPAGHRLRAGDAAFHVRCRRGVGAGLAGGRRGRRAAGVAAGRRRRRGQRWRLARHAPSCADGGASRLATLRFGRQDARERLGARSIGPGAQPRLQPQRRRAQRPLRVAPRTSRRGRHIGRSAWTASGAGTAPDAPGPAGSGPPRRVGPGSVRRAQPRPRSRPPSQPPSQRHSQRCAWRRGRRPRRPGRRAPPRSRPGCRGSSRRCRSPACPRCARGARRGPAR